MNESQGGQGGFYDFRTDSRALRIDSRETFRCNIEFPGIPKTLILYRLKIAISCWRRIKRHCPSCRMRRPRWKGNDDWLDHVFECLRKRGRGETVHGST